MKDHMDSNIYCSRTRCGQPIDEPHGPRIISWGYGSPKTTCKSCLRLHALDIAKSGDDQ